jgi:uncharacterized protein (TIGR04255 family)
VSEKTHPTFPNPAIREAICEIHFQLPEGCEWQSDYFESFYKRIEKEFPKFEPATIQGIQIEVGDSGTSHKWMPHRQLLRYRHSEKNALIQLSPQLLTVNVLPKYEGWLHMRKWILYAWAELKNALNVKGINRVGLRYINTIERGKSGETIGTWIKSNDYIPKSLVKATAGSLLRLELKQQDARRATVTVGDAQGTPPPVVLDIDCISESGLAATKKALAEEIEVLHDQAWEIFSTSISKRLETRLYKEAT